MADPQVNLFAPSTQDDIRVGYISTTRGYVTGVGIRDANKYAQSDPGTKFILQNRDYIKYLNINEVNKLTPDVLETSEGADCGGVQWEAPLEDPEIIFSGGGGVGVVGNPVIGQDGALLAVDLVSGGFGYKYPPTVKLRDSSNRGAGAHLIAKVGDIAPTEILYDKEEDFEEYIVDEDNVVGIGSWYGPDGKVIGRWDPSLYVGDEEPPFDVVADKYIKRLQKIATSGIGGQGIVLDAAGTSGKYSDFTTAGDSPVAFDDGLSAGVFWWAAKPPGPNLVAGNGKTTRKIYKVEHVAWNEIPPKKNNQGKIIDWSTNGWLNTHAISPIPPSHAKGSDNAGEMFTMEWDVEFPWDGEYSFKGCADNNAIVYVDNQELTRYKLGSGGAAGKVLSLPTIVKKEVTEGTHKIRIDLKNSPIIEKQKVQASSKTYGSLLQLEDIPNVDAGAQGGVTYDDLQCYAKVGRFFDINANKAKYKVDPSLNQPEGSELEVEYKVTSNSAFVNKIEVKDLFTEQGPEVVDGAPTPPKISQIEASAKFSSRGSGKNTKYYMTVTGNDLVEVQLEFRKHRDDSTRGGGHSVNAITIQTEDAPLELLSGPVSPSSTWPFDNAMITVKKGRFKNGKEYEITFSEARFQAPAPSPRIQYIGLRIAANLRWVNSKTLEFDDFSENGWDTNATFTIDSGDVVFGPDGMNLVGSRGMVTMTYTWNDNPNTAGKVLNEIHIGDTKWFQTNENSGSQTQTFYFTTENAPPPQVTHNDKMIAFFDEDVSDGASASAPDLIGDVRAHFNILNIEQLSSSVPDLPGKLELKQLNTTFKKTVIVGKVYPVTVTNAGQGLMGNTPAPIGALKAKDIINQDAKLENNTEASVEKYDVFNTVDYITSANRKLWRTNVNKRGGFMNEYGVCPFDTYDTLPDNPYAGTHTIRWNNINFPISGNYNISIGVDDNVDLKIGNAKSGNVLTISKKGYTFPAEGGIKSTGIGNYVRYIEAGRYTIQADLEQIPGGQFGFGKIKGKGAIHDYSGYGLNPMVLAINIETSVASFEGKVAKSWHANPMGVALNIKAPLPPAPVQPIPLQEGRCPRNPIWSTRFPDAKDGTWYPVRFDSWGKFHNKYGMSPVPPLPTGGTDNGGIPFTNRWDVDIPYDGWYKLKAIMDDIGKISIDGDVKLELSNKRKVEYEEKLFFLSAGLKEVEVEIENNSTRKVKIIDQKVFNTKDWVNVNPNTGGGIQKVDFKVTSSSAFINSINIKGLFYKAAPKWESTTRVEDTFVPAPVIPAKVEFIKRGAKYYLKAYGNKTVKVTFDFRVHEDDRNIGGGPSIRFVNIQTMKSPVRFNTLSDTTMSGWPFRGSTDVNNDSKREAIFENGKEYEVTFGGLLSRARSTPPIKYIGLKSAAHRRFANSKTLEFDDNPANGWDTNATFTIDSGDVTFSEDGTRLIGTKNEKATLTYSWTDNPDIAGVVLDEIQLGGQTWKQSGPSTIQYIGLRTTANMRFVNNRTLEFDDFSENGWDTNATFTIDSGNATFSADGLKLLGLGGTVTMTYTWNDNPNTAGVVLDEIKIGSTTWTQSGTSGTVTHTFDYTGITGSVTRTIDFIPDPNPTSPPLIGGLETPTICFFDGDTSAGATIGPDFNGDVRAYITALNVIQMDDPELLEGEPVDVHDKKLVQSINPDPISRDVVVGKVYDVELANAGQGAMGNYPAPVGALKVNGGVVKLEDLPNVAAGSQGGVTYDDLVCSASHGRFYDVQGNKCKYIIDAPTSGGATRDGVTYEGPKLFNYKHKSYGSWLNSDGVSPDYPVNDTGKTINYVWKNVDFPETVEYTFKFANDAHGSLYLDGEVVIDGDFDTVAGISDQDRRNWDPGLVKKMKVNKGKHTIAVAPKGRLGLTDVNADGLFKKLSPDYYRGQQAWDNNASAMAVSITRKVDALEGTAASSKSWMQNPISISAELVPPPCPRLIEGGGVVTEVEIHDGGNGYQIGDPPEDDPVYPVLVNLNEIVIDDPGINYNCAGDEIVIEPSNGAQADLICDNFGRIKEVKVNNPGIGFTGWPQIYIDSPTGVAAELRPKLSTVIVPPGAPDLDPDKLIQVTDLVGLKQTGYYDGKPYYGAVFYKDGVKYAGYYETTGTLVQIYDTMQESIDGMITTPPSAILRQGTDIASDDPNLDIPNTPDTLT